MRMFLLLLMILLPLPGLVLAQGFDDWGELRVLGLGAVWSLEYSPDSGKLAVGGTGGLRYFDVQSYQTDIQMNDAGSVRTLNWSPNGRRVVAINQSDFGGTVKMWDVETGRLIRTHQQENLLSAWQVAWSPDGTKIAAGFGRRDIGAVLTIWDARTGQEVKTIRAGGDDYEVSALSWSPDSLRIASGPATSANYDIKIWDVETGDLVRRLHGHGWSILSIKWSPDGTKIASGSLDATTRIWNVKTGAAIRVHGPLEGAVISVSWSPDSSKVAAGFGGLNRGIVRVWDAENGKELASLYGHSSTVYAISWSPDGRQLASGTTLDPKIIVWDTETYQELTTITIGHRDPVQSVSWSPDGKRLASASGRGSPPPAYDQTIRIWDAETYEELNVLSGHEGIIASLSWSPDGRRIASGSFDGTLRVWDVQSGQELKTIDLGYRLVHVSWSPDGTKIAAGGGFGGESVTIWDAETYKEWKNLPEAAIPLSWSPDSRKLATRASSPFNILKTWDVETGNELNTFSGHTYGLSRICWSPDGSKIASLEGVQWRVKIWDAETAEELWPPQFAGGYSLSWSADGTNLAIGRSERNGIEIWDVESHRLLRSLIGHGILINAVSWSPRGDRIASGSADLTVRIWGERTE